MWTGCSSTYAAAAHKFLWTCTLPYMCCSMYKITTYVETCRGTGRLVPTQKQSILCYCTFMYSHSFISLYFVWKIGNRSTDFLDRVYKQKTNKPKNRFSTCLRSYADIFFGCWLRPVLCHKHPTPLQCGGQSITDSLPLCIFLFYCIGSVFGVIVMLRNEAVTNWTF